MLSLQTTRRDGVHSKSAEDHFNAVFAPGRMAVITGAASGIGRATAIRLAGMGMKLALADRTKEGIEATAKAAGSGDAIAFPCDVADPNALAALAEAVAAAGGDVALLMNNAGIGPNPGAAWENLEGWRTLVDVNFWGAVHGVQAFGDRMIKANRPAAIVNTGSKQGITTPPGNLAYNVSKAALKTYTEGLSHALRNLPGGAISAHLLIPGFTYTGLTTGATEKPAGAWTPEQVTEFMLDSLKRGDFYILCPDNETDRATDEKRMAWAIGDIIENRPALSRWHPDYKDAFVAALKR